MSKPASVARRTTMHTLLSSVPVVWKRVEGVMKRQLTSEQKLTGKEKIEKRTPLEETPFKKGKEIKNVLFYLILYCFFIFYFLFFIFYFLFFINEEYFMIRVCCVNVLSLVCC